MKMDSNDEAILKTLTVDTLRIYNYFLKRNPNEITLEELSQNFKITKPAVLHHIEKLKRADLIEQTLNGYKVRNIVKITVIRGYTNRIYEMLKIWLPITMLFAFLLGLSFLLAGTTETKALTILLSIMGMCYSVYNILKFKQV